VQAFRILALASALASMGCADTFGPIAARIKPLDDGTYEFMAPTGLNEDRDPIMENKRLTWLGEKMRINGFCAEGYDIM
jgi:hypothetical protein